MQANFNYIEKLKSIIISVIYNKKKEKQKTQIRQLVHDTS